MKNSARSVGGRLCSAFAVVFLLSWISQFANAQQTAPTRAALIVAEAVQAQYPEGTPLWAYPTNPPGFKPVPDDGVPRRVPGSNASYTVTQLRNRFIAPDWHPQEYPAMPEVVRQGRKPNVSACGFCHRAGGTGGPENANIAGLPRAYIVRQMQEYKSGVRSTAVPRRAPLNRDVREHHHL